MKIMHTGVLFWGVPMMRKINFRSILLKALGWFKPRPRFDELNSIPEDSEDGELPTPEEVQREADEEPTF